MDCSYRVDQGRVEWRGHIDMIRYALQTSRIYRRHCGTVFRKTALLLDTGGDEFNGRFDRV